MLLDVLEWYLGTLELSSFSTVCFDAFDFVSLNIMNNELLVSRIINDGAVIMWDKLELSVLLIDTRGNGQVI